MEALLPFPSHALVIPYAPESHSCLPASSSLPSKPWSRWPPQFSFQYANESMWLPAEEVLMTLHWPEPGLAGSSPSDSNLQFSLDLLPFPSRPPTVDLYLATCCHMPSLVCRGPQAHDIISPNQGDMARSCNT